MMTTPAMRASSDLYCARIWPTSVEIAPKVMKTMLKPMMNAAELSITLRKSCPSCSFSCSTPTPEIRETYPGTSGSTQGDKNYSVMSSAGAIREVDPLPPADRYNKEIAAHGRSDDRIDLAAEVSSPFPPVAAKAGTYSEDYLRFDGARRLLKQDAEEGKLSPRWKAEMEKHIA